MTNNGAIDWGLEVVRGREVGRVFPLRAGRSVLGNGLNGEPGVDLSGQEGTSPRRMAARQAEVAGDGGQFSIRDLDSPGGTFVNSQRLLPGQTRKLGPGDLIQLGSVQVRLVPPTAPVPEKSAPPAPASAPPPASAPTTSGRPGSLPAPFVLATGESCRTWDDFLTVSAKDWAALREELTSGRLLSFLRAVGRDDLQPSAGSTKPPDERLDDWLGRLPTTRPTQPDLEVHPAVVRLRAVPGGGLTRSKVVVTNTGYRLLRSTVRVEPPTAGWLKVAPTFAPGTFTTAETTEIALDVQVPENLAAPLSASLVIESNGGSRRVEIRVEPAAKTDIPPGDGVGFAPGSGTTLREALERLPAWKRVIGGAVGAAAVRAILIAGDETARLLNLSTVPRPSLTGGALLLGAIGGVAAAQLAARRGGVGDVLPGGFAGAFAGVLAASAAVAVCRAIEPALGTTISGSPLGVCLLWTALGAIAGLWSLGLVRYRKTGGESR